MELALRTLALAGLSALIWRAVRPHPDDTVDIARGDLGSALAEWTSAPPSRAHVVIDAVPDRQTRDWIRALVRSGTPVQWSAAKPIAPSVVVAEPAADPYGATRVRLASNGSGPVAIVDAAGLIDTLPEGGNAELDLGAVSGAVRARGTTFVATTAARDRVTLRPVLVLGTAGWEPKFAIAALEENGWRVAARLRVGPGIDVTQGSLGAIDTALYSAVIVVDSAAASSAAAIARYARAGGGVVLVGNTARLPSLAPIAAGGVGRRMPGVAGAIASETPRNGLGAFSVAPLRPDAVPLEARGEATMVAARRVEAGRVIQLGYDETWRWRMSGGDEAVRAHRAWWSRIVASVAYAPLVPHVAATDAVRDEAPLAALHSALGTPVAYDPAVAPTRDASPTTRFLFLLVVAALLLEWVSRRLRGAR